MNCWTNVVRNRRNVLARWALAIFAASTLVGCSPAPTGGPVERPEPAPGQFEVSFQTLNEDVTTVEVMVTPVLDNTWPGPPPVTNQEVMQGLFSVRLVGKDSSVPAPPLAGDYSFSENRLRFRPRHPLVRGERYRLEFQPAKLGGNQTGTQSIVTEHVVPAAPRADRPRIEAIYPSGANLPANHLKFYIVFSEPMETGSIFQHFKLIEGRDRIVPDPFRETELWSSDGRRLTLWLHPGRQKTGVNLNEELGPVLKAGASYGLYIGPEWRSQRGIPLGLHDKIFVAGEADHAQPRMNDWNLILPGPINTGSVTVEFPEPMDWALLQTRLWIEDDQGKRLAGKGTSGFQERSWTFTPTEPWRPGTYHLAAESVFEDLAGNSLARPFEVESGKEPPKVPDVLRREFVIPLRPESGGQQ